MNEFSRRYPEFDTTTVRFAEVRVSISNPRDSRTRTSAMALDEEEIRTLEAVDYFRKRMEQTSKEDLLLATSEYQRAMKQADDVTMMIATKIAHSIRRAFEAPVPRTVDNSK